MRRPKQDAQPAAGSIRADELLPLKVARCRLGVGIKGMAQLRRAGLPVRRFGRQGFILGRDVLRFFSELPADGEE